VRGQDRDAQLGLVAAAREVRGTGELQVVVEHAEDDVAVEIDARHVVVDRRIRDGEAKAQPAVLGIELAQVGGVLGALQLGEFAGQDLHGASTCAMPARFAPLRYAASGNDSRAARSVSSISAASCAKDTKPAS
jgi:hypothetical protein